MLRTRWIHPHPALQPFICSFVQRDASYDLSESSEPVVARLGVMLNFKFAGSYRIRTLSSNTSVRPNPVSIVGPQTFRRVDLTLSGNVDNLAVMFQPCGFYALFGTPTVSTADKSFEGQAVLGKAITQLYERLGDLCSFPERIRLLNAYFLRCLSGAKGFSPAYAALQQITRNSHTSVLEVARQAGLSQRQLERKALVYAGVSPKTMARIARFNSALQLSRRSSLSWTGIAHATGYHDHMHLIKDWRAFAGSVPSSLKQEIAPDHLIHFSGSCLEVCAELKSGMQQSLDPR